MKTSLSVRLAAVAVAAFSMTAANASPLCSPAAMSVSGLNVILAAGASQCETSCMASYDSCVSTGLAAQAVADDEVVYEECSAKLEGCRNVCISRGDCVTDDTGVVLCP